MCSWYWSRLYVWLQPQVRLTTCDPLQRSRIHSFHRHSCSWSSLSDLVCLHWALTWKLSDEHNVLLPLQKSMVQCGSGKCDQRWEFMTISVVNHGKKKIHQHTHRSYLPNNNIWGRYILGLLVQGNKVDPGHSLAVFDSLCVALGPSSPPSTHSATWKRY